MPEVWFEVKWPDGSSDVCYSPSTVIERRFAKGQRYTLRAFLEAARPAFEEASQRVEAKYGYRCTSADDQLRIIEQAARQMDLDGEVTILYVGRVPP
jgi:uncharacterized repeat protein (TIGR04042 family)